MTEQRPRIIAIFNTNSEVLDLVRESLQGAGYATVVAHLDDLKRGRLDMIQFVEVHEPEVIVYDVAPPYDTNWTFLRLMMNSAFRAADEYEECPRPCLRHWRIDFS